MLLAYYNSLLLEVYITDSQALMEEFKVSARSRRPLTLLLFTHPFTSKKCAPFPFLARAKH